MSKTTELDHAVATPDDDLAEVVPLVVQESPAPTSAADVFGRNVKEGIRRQLSWTSIKRDIVGVKALRTTKYGMSPLLLLMLFGFVQSLDGATFGALGPEIRQELGLTIKQMGDIGAMLGLVGLAIGPIYGHLIDRVNRIRLIGIGAVLSGVFSLLTVRAQGVTQVFATRTFDSFSDGLASAPVGTLLYDYYPVEVRGKIAAFSGTVGKAVGLIVGPLVGFLALRLGWRMPFLVTGPAVAITGVLVMRKLQDPIRGYWERVFLGASEETAADPEPPVRAGEALRSVWAIRTLRRNLIAGALTTTLSGASSFLMGYYLLERFRLNAFQRSLVGVPTGIVGIIAIVIGGALTDVLIRYRPSRLMVFQGVVGIIFSFTHLLMILAPSIWLMVGLRMVSSFVGGVTGPATAVISAQILPPRLRGFGLSIVGSAMGLLGVMSSSLGGRMSQSFGLYHGLLLLSPVPVVAGLIHLSAAKYFEFDMRAAFSSAMAKDEYRKAKAAGGNRLLICKDVDVSYGNVQVLFNVDLVVEQGEIVALLGTNGAGKSTLLRAIAGTQQASNGAVYFDGRDITHLPPNDITKLGVISMPGGRGVFPGLTVNENLGLALWQAQEGAKERLEQVFEFFPVLRERLDQDAGSLSGGEQQMVALGQAFLAKPRLLMIDELSLGLSPAVVAQLLDIVRAIHDQGTTIILVEQSVNVALSIAQRAVFMEKGEVRFEGPTADLLARPDLMRSVYVKGAGALTGGVARRRSSVEASRPLLEVHGLTKRYGGKLAVGDVSFTLHEGQAIGIIGPNGAGKTTLFDLISGRQPADAGRVVLDGVDISRETADARARARLVRRFQDARLFPSLTVHETLCVALEQRLEVRNTFLLASRAPMARRSERRARAAADRLIELFDLGSYRDKFASELSTGLRRVVDLACVIAADPRVLMLDEPSSGIAQAEAENLAPLLRRVRHETGCSLLIIEHDMTLIRNVSDELIGMTEGRIVVQGTADEVLSHDTIVAAYLGDKSETIERQGRLR